MLAPLGRASPSATAPKREIETHEHTEGRARLNLSALPQSFPASTAARWTISATAMGDHRQDRGRQLLHAIAIRSLSARSRSAPPSAMPSIVVWAPCAAPARRPNTIYSAQHTPAPSAQTTDGCQRAPLSSSSSSPSTASAIKKSTGRRDASIANPKGPVNSKATAMPRGCNSTRRRKEIHAAHR